MTDLRNLVVLDKLPECDYCRSEGVNRPARYDFRSLARVWAYGCQEHYEIHRASDTLGTGNGQYLATGSEMEVQGECLGGGGS